MIFPQISGDPRRCNIEFTSYVAARFAVISCCSSGCQTDKETLGCATKGLIVIALLELGEIVANDRIPFVRSIAAKGRYARYFGFHKSCLPWRGARFRQ